MTKLYLTAVAAVLSVMGLVITFAPASYVSGIGAGSGGIALLNAVGGFGGLYLGFSAWLFFSIGRKDARDRAVQACVAVTGGLALARAACMAMIGVPPPKLLAAGAVELALALWGILAVVRKTRRKADGQAD